jgi:Flp pilus assembly pilin Flp
MSAGEAGCIGDHRCQGQAGQGLVEYALIVALVALVVTTIMVALGPQIGEVFSGVYGKVRGISSVEATPVATVEPGTTATPGPPQVFIDPSCSCFDCPVPSSGKSGERITEDERICFTSKEAYPVDMTGWLVRDAVQHQYMFVPFQLRAGASVTLHTARGADTETDVYWGRNGNIWDDKGDTAYLLDAALVLIDEYSYGRGGQGQPESGASPAPPTVEPAFPEGEG